MRVYNIYVDENLPPQLARGLNILLQPTALKENLTINILSIKDSFGEGTKDEEWIPKVGRQNGVVLTQDYNIQSQKHQKELYQKHGVGILFINTPSKSGFAYWDIMKLIINRWEEIMQIVKRNKPPFAYRCTARTNFQRIESD